MLQDFPIRAYFPAMDLARARRFYEETLGLRDARPMAGGVAYAFADGTAAFLYPTPNAGTSRASQAFWQVRDIDALIDALRARGVVFESYPDMPGERTRSGAVVAGGAKAAWFKDTEGNILALVEDAG
jgi:predicted enzyme related to lactoylglutathione lyase